MLLPFEDFDKSHYQATDVLTNETISILDVSPDRYDPEKRPLLSSERLADVEGLPSKLAHAKTMGFLRTNLKLVKGPLYLWEEEYDGPALETIREAIAHLIGIKPIPLLAYDEDYTGRKCRIGKRRQWVFYKYLGLDEAYHAGETIRRKDSHVYELLSPFSAAIVDAYLR